MAEEDEVRITLRLPKSLRDRIAASAERQGRSMNGEIVQALEQAYPDPIASFYDGFLEQILTTNDVEQQTRLLALANEHLEKVEKTKLRVKILRRDANGYPTLAIGGVE